MLHMEEQWIRNIAITTGLVNHYSTPTLLRLVASRQVGAQRFITCRAEAAGSGTGYAATSCWGPGHQPDGYVPIARMGGGPQEAC